MKITSIKKIVDSIYFGNLTDEERDNIKLYAPYFLINDSNGRYYISNCKWAKRFDSFKNLIIFLGIIWYLFFLLVYPIFYSSINVNNFFVFIKSASFGLTDFLYNVKWYWEILFHFVAIILILISSTILDELFDIDYGSYPKHRNILYDYILILHKKGLINENLLRSKSTVPNSKIKDTKKQNNMDLLHNEIFIVHGHDDSAKYEVARFVEKIGLNAIILHEQINSGKTIIEKIEQYTNVVFSLVLLTPDDLMVDSKSLPIKRARQNVIFELGYLMAKLGRQRICALVKDNVEIPSDISGVVYIPYDKDGAWKIKVAKEMKAVNINIDFNSIY